MSRRQAAGHLTPEFDGQAHLLQPGPGHRDVADDVMARQAKRLLCTGTMCLFCATLLALNAGIASAREALLVTNHYRFPVHDVVEVPGPGGTGMRVEVQLEPGEQQRVTPGDAATLRPQVVRRFESGLPAVIRAGNGMETRLFDLALIEAVDDPDLMAVDRLSAVMRAAAIAAAEDRRFEQVSTRSKPGSVAWQYVGRFDRDNPYELVATYHIFPSGLVDVELLLRREGGAVDEGYLGVVKHLPAEPQDQAVVRWKGEVRPLEAGGTSPTRSVRSHHWSHDVSWLALSDPTGTTAILADVVPNLTRQVGDRIQPANDFAVNEVVVAAEAGWHMVAEIATGNAQENYVPSQQVLPRPEEPISLRYRCLPHGLREAEEVDQAFITFAGYRMRERTDGTERLDLGVAGVSFGTSYFPHRTFGENFEFWRSAGLQGDRWWPLFGENWRHFKDDIRRDMRIANALGLEWIRIHHFDAPDRRDGYLTSPEGRWMLEYLDFMVETARECGLKLFLDCAIGAEDAAMVADRHGEVIRYIEIQNEVLLTGIRLNLLDYWRDVYRRVKEVDPDLRVLLTGGPMFLSVYDRLAALNVPVDAVGQHAYVDGRQAPAYVRDIAVGVGGYASRRGLQPLNSEFNWRMITRETEQQQADHFEEIVEHLLSQQQLPLLLQFQFQETFCVPPRVRGALRHYELLRVDRTPKPQALAFAEVIQRYALPDSRSRTLRINFPAQVEVKPGETTDIPVRLQNLSDGHLELRTSPVLPQGLSLAGTNEERLAIEPGESATIIRRIIAADDLPPGVHHFFEEVRYDDQVHFGWGFATRRARPQVDTTTAPLPQVTYGGGLERLGALDLSRMETVVFGRKAPALEVDWALYLYHSLRAATGADINRFSDADLQTRADPLASNLLLVGTPGSNAMIGDLLDRLPINPRTLPGGHGVVQVIHAPHDEDQMILVVSGADAEGVERAASDLLRRYWRHAAASVSFREGMPPIETTAAAHAAPPQAGEILMIRGPEEAVVGEQIHLVVLTASEPPGPAGGVELIARAHPETAIRLGTSTATGELSVMFDEPGIYTIVPSLPDDETGDAARAVPFQITIRVPD